MRTTLLLATLLVASAAIGALLLFQSGPDGGGAPPPAPAEADAGGSAGSDPAQGVGEESPQALREWRTWTTLAEDLRDTLADEDALEGVFVDVSRDLRGSAAAFLGRAAAAEKSPRVRALLVLAAGRHVPDEPALLAFLEDRFAVVRAGAALAAGWSDGAAPVTFLGCVRVPVGRPLAATTETRVRAALERETDEEARSAMRAVLTPR